MQQAYSFLNLIAINVLEESNAAEVASLNVSTFVRHFKLYKIISLSFFNNTKFFFFSSFKYVYKSESGKLIASYSSLTTNFFPLTIPALSPYSTGIYP